MAEPTHETLKLIKYLIDSMPESLEVKSADGYTPLLIAFALHRSKAAQILIEAGADQTVRTSTGANILDVLLVDPYTNTFINRSKILKRMLSLIDTRLVPSLLEERTSASPGSLTPIAHLMTRLGGYHYEELKDAVLDTLLDFAAPTNYKSLELLDGSGDTPLHWAVKNKHSKYITAILARRPDLLYHENSVGRTPLEMAEDACLADRVRDAPALPTRSRHSITDRPTESFAKDYEANNAVNTAEYILKICSEVAAKKSGKRKLVSLLDANEVANRLAKRHMGRRAAQTVANEEGDEVDEVQREVDEVRDWYRRAVRGDGEVKNVDVDVDVEMVDSEL